MLGALLSAGRRSAALGEKSGLPFGAAALGARFQRALSCWHVHGLVARCCTHLGRATPSSVVASAACPVSLGRFTLGGSLLLASLGVYIRDLPQVVSLVLSLLQFLSPVFYPVSALPPALQPVLGWNPLTVFIEQVRALVFSGALPSVQMWAQSLLVSTLLAVLAYVFFRRVRGGFADVL